MFIYISATRHAVAKRMPPFESPRQISLNTPSKGAVIMGAAPSSVYLKIAKIGLIGDIFNHFSTTSGDTGNCMVQTDSADRTGLIILWKELLIAGALKIWLLVTFLITVGEWLEICRNG